MKLIFKTYTNQQISKIFILKICTKTENFIISTVTTSSMNFEWFRTIEEKPFHYQVIEIKFQLPGKKLWRLLGTLSTYSFGHGVVVDELSAHLVQGGNEPEKSNILTTQNLLSFFLYRKRHCFRLSDAFPLFSFPKSLYLIEFIKIIFSCTIFSKKNPDTLFSYLPFKKLKLLCIQIFDNSKFSIFELFFHISKIS